VSFRDEAEQGPVPVEAPWAALLRYLQTRLVVTVQEHIAGAAPGILVGQLERLGAEPLTPTTVTRQSGRMPRTAALGLRSSSLVVSAKRYRPPPQALLQP